MAVEIPAKAGLLASRLVPERKGVSIKDEMAAARATATITIKTCPYGTSGRATQSLQNTITG